MLRAADRPLHDSAHLWPRRGDDSARDPLRRRRASSCARALVLPSSGPRWPPYCSHLAQVTRERVARNQQSWIRQPLYALLEPGSYDNDLLADSRRGRVARPARHGVAGRRSIARAATVSRSPWCIHTVAPDGYRGPIELLVAIAADGALARRAGGASQRNPRSRRCVRERETPTGFERFAACRCRDPPQQRWTVRKDGGDFDAFTGATITPRAIVKAVRRALEFYRAQRDRCSRRATPP